MQQDDDKRTLEVQLCVLIGKGISLVVIAGIILLVAGDKAYGITTLLIAAIMIVGLIICMPRKKKY